jgi:hypothetical protein
MVMGVGAASDKTLIDEKRAGDREAGVPINPDLLEWKDRANLLRRGLTRVGP